jgi:hypothetical protein
MRLLAAPLPLWIDRGSKSSLSGLLTETMPPHDAATRQATMRTLPRIGAAKRCGIRIAEVTVIEFQKSRCCGESGCPLSADRSRNTLANPPEKNLICWHFGILPAKKISETYEKDDL